MHVRHRRRRRRRIVLNTVPVLLASFFAFALVFVIVLASGRCSRRACRHSAALAMQRIVRST